MGGVGVENSIFKTEFRPIGKSQVDFSISPLANVLLSICGFSTPDNATGPVHLSRDTLTPSGAYEKVFLGGEIRSSIIGRKMGREREKTLFVARQHWPRSAGNGRATIHVLLTGPRTPSPISIEVCLVSEEVVVEFWSRFQFFALSVKFFFPHTFGFNCGNFFRSTKKLFANTAKKFFGIFFRKIF